MWGTPNCLSRMIVTPGFGSVVDSTLAGLTPKVASLKYREIFAFVRDSAPWIRLSYSGCWSIQCFGRWPVVAYFARSAALSVPSSPGGSTLRKPPASLVPYGGTGGAIRTLDWAPDAPEEVATASASVAASTTAPATMRAVRW